MLTGAISTTAVAPCIALVVSVQMQKRHRHLTRLHVVNQAKEQLEVNMCVGDGMQEHCLVGQIIVVIDNVVQVGGDFFAVIDSVEAGDLSQSTGDLIGQPCRVIEQRHAF